MMGGDSGCRLSCSDRGDTGVVASEGVGGDGAGVVERRAEIFERDAFCRTIRKRGQVL